jgi:tRNA(Ile)-lysidine synthase
VDAAVTRVLDAIAAAGLLADARIVALVSGGRDSVCLLDALTAVCGPAGLLALHVNYGLRPAAAGDELHCAQLCERLGVEFRALAPRRPDDAGNLQAWARAFRYGAAATEAAARGALVATGHTATDQLETVLYRLASSPGRRALLGMAPRDGLLVRPLLGLDRADTAAYCRARRLGWRDDETNESDLYARGRVRNQLVPALRAIHPAATDNVLRTAQLLRDEAAVLDEVVSTALAGRDRIALSRLAALPAALARLVVIRLAERAAGHLVPSAGDRVAELLALAPQGGSAELDVGGGVSAVVEYGVLRMAAPDRSPHGRPGPQPVALSVPGRVRFGAWEVFSELSSAAQPAPLVAGGSVGTLDADAVGAQLTVRGWRAGDRMAPLGLGGSKALSDLFGERRLPRAQRATVPVVAAGETIAWVPGIATAEAFRVTAETRRTVVLHAEHAAP